MTAKKKSATTKTKRTARAKVEAKGKKISALDGAAQVLGKAGESMTTGQIIEAMSAAGIWASPKGKTPHATLFSAMQREINTKGKEARFKKAERGKFTLA